MEQLHISRENVRIADFKSPTGFRTFLTIHNRFVQDLRGTQLVDEIFSR
jgi:hypothetical protein